MKSDKTLPPSSTSITASERPFTNQPPPEKKLPTLPFKESKKNCAKTPLIEDKTSTSESTTTAHGAAPQNEIAPATAPAPTPRRHEPKVTPATAAAKVPKRIPSKPPSKPTLAPVGASNPRNPMVFFDESTVSPTFLEDDQHPRHPLPSSSSSAESSTEFFHLTKFKENIYQIQEDQSKQISLIRKLSNKKWIMFFDTILAGFTLVFFLTAFYLIFHINPTIESKLTQEYRLKVQPFTVKDSFQRCNHTSWIRTDDSLAPIIDDSLCFTRYVDGRYLTETFKSSTPNSSDVCNMDRIEIHPCYSKRMEDDPVNIYFGRESKYLFYTFIQTCNGTIESNSPNVEDYNLYSFNPPVLKHHINMSEQMNRTVSSTAFFFQCPKCSLMYRAPNFNQSESEKHGNSTPFILQELASSIPPKIKECYPTWDMTCDFNRNVLIQRSQRSFSHQVFPYYIVHDRDLYNCS